MDLDVWCSRVRKPASVYLISVVCSCSTLNHLSWKTNFKVIVKKLFLAPFKINWCTLSQRQQDLKSLLMNRLTFYSSKEVVGFRQRHDLTHNNFLLHVPNHALKVALHFFTRTRFSRTTRLKFVSKK